MIYFIIPDKVLAFALPYIKTMLKLQELRKLLREELTIQYERYTKYIWGRLAGLTFTLLVFILVPLGLQYLIPFMLQSMSEATMYTIVYWTSLTSPGFIICFSMWYVYKAKIPFLQQYRVAPEKPWPWEENPKDWNKTLVKSLFLNFVNLCTYVPFFLYNEAKMKIPYVLDLSETPSLWTIIKVFTFIVILEDLLTTITHRIFHIGPFYTYVHKLHHQYHTTVTIAGLHTHIIESIVSGGIPTKIYFTITTMLFGPLHVSIAVIWNLLRMYDTYMGHSGYMFSWNPNQIFPFCANDGYHDFHHSHNCGNYGAQLRIWDMLCGSSRPFKDFKQQLRLKEEKAEEKKTE